MVVFALFFLSRLCLNCFSSFCILWLRFWRYGLFFLDVSVCNCFSFSFYHVLSLFILVFLWWYLVLLPVICLTTCFLSFMTTCVLSFMRKRCVFLSFIRNLPVYFRIGLFFNLFVGSAGIFCQVTCLFFFCRGFGWPFSRA